MQQIILIFREHILKSLEVKEYHVSNLFLNISEKTPKTCVHLYIYGERETKVL